MSSPSSESHPGFGATVAALSFGQLVSWAALYYTFTSMVLPMQRELGWSNTVLMGAFTLALAVWGAASYAVGAAIDRGHGRAVMTTGSVFAALSFVLWSQAVSPWMLYAAGVAMGIAMAMTLYDPAFSVLTRRYPERYREGITTLTLVGGFASTLAFPVVASLLACCGWRGTLLFIAGGLLLVIAPLHAWALRGPALVAAPAGVDESSDSTLRQALNTRAFWLLATAFTFFAFATAALWSHAMPAFASKGVSDAQVLVVLMCVGPAQVAARLFYAGLLRLGWRISLHRLGVFVLAGLPLGLTLFALADSMALLVVFALLFGFANGLVTIVRGGLVPEYFGRTNIGRIGGALSAIALFARAAAPLAAAWLLLPLPGYRELVLVLAGLGVVALLAFALAHAPAAVLDGASR